MTDGPDAAVALMGARERYAAARGIQARGRLWRFFTDLWIPPRASCMLGLLGLGKRSQARYHEALEGYVTAFPLGGLGYRWKLRRATELEVLHRTYVAAGAWFCRRVNAAIDTRPDRDCLRSYLGFTCGALETLRHLRRRGVWRVLSQIDAGPRHFRLLEEQRRRWPGWDLSESRVPELYWDRVRGEWEEADCIVVNSEWTRDALREEGVPDSRIRMVPLCVELPEGKRLGPAPSLTSPRLPWTFLWVGKVNLMKGFPYLVEAVRRLPPGPWQVWVAGPVEIRQDKLQCLPPSIRLLGPVPRVEVASLYRRADVLVAPTLSDGFGVTQLEALAFGVPVITTDHCARVVRHGQEGWIVPPGDAAALAEAMRRAMEEPERWTSMRKAAVQRAAEFSLARYGELLCRCLEPDVGGRSVRERG